jgi:hypothetical protein
MQARFFLLVGLATTTAASAKAQCVPVNGGPGHVATSVLAEARGSAGSSNLVNSSSAASVDYRNGVLTGTPTAVNGGSYGVEFSGPCATTVQARTGAFLPAVGSASSNASASLERGELKATAATQTTTGLSGASASARLDDAIWFNNASSDWQSFTLVFRVDGSMSAGLSRSELRSSIFLSTPTTGNNALNQRITPDRTTNPGGFFQQLLGEVSAGVYPFAFRQIAGDLDWWQFDVSGNDPLAGLFDYSQSIQLWVPTGQTTLSLSTFLEVPVCNGTGVCDFGNTGSIRFEDMGDGLSFTSASGVFLSGLAEPVDPPVSVPEPAAIVLLLTGAAALLAHTLRRSQRSHLP